MFYTLVNMVFARDPEYKQLSLMLLLIDSLID